MRKDIINSFCEGKKPKELIEKAVASPKTIYYYHAIYNDLKEFFKSDEYVNMQIKGWMTLRIKS